MRVTVSLVVLICGLQISFALYVPWRSFTEDEIREYWSTQDDENIHGLDETDFKEFKKFNAANIEADKDDRILVIRDPILAGELGDDDKRTALKGYNIEYLGKKVTIYSKNKLDEKEPLELEKTDESKEASTDYKWEDNWLTLRDFNDKHFNSENDANAKSSVETKDDSFYKSDENLYDNDLYSKPSEEIHEKRYEDRIIKEIYELNKKQASCDNLYDDDGSKEDDNDNRNNIDKNSDGDDNDNNDDNDDNAYNDDNEDNDDDNDDNYDNDDGNTAYKNYNDDDDYTNDDYSGDNEDTGNDDHDNNNDDYNTNDNDNNDDNKSNDDKNTSDAEYDDDDNNFQFSFISLDGKTQNSLSNHKNYVNPISEIISRNIWYSTIYNSKGQKDSLEDVSDSKDSDEENVRGDIISQKLRESFLDFFRIHSNFEELTKTLHEKELNMDKQFMLTLDDPGKYLSKFDNGISDVYETLEDLKQVTIKLQKLQQNIYIHNLINDVLSAKAA